MSDTGRKHINYVHVGSIVVNISPSGFLNYAKDFFETGKSFNSASHFSPVPYYLFCHALELSLKAYLLTQGVLKDELRDRNKYGHNLNKILNKAIKRGLNALVPVSDIVKGEITKANDYYNNKHFEYFEVTKAIMGYKDLPDMAIVETFIHDVMKRIEPICRKA